MTQTKNSSTGTVIKLIDQTLQELGEKPPSSAEVQDAIDEISNGFVFNFQSPAQVVSRQMFYLTQNLPLNWLSTYLEGIQRTNAQDIHNIFRENLARNGLEDMVTVVVGNHDLLESELNKIGTVYAIEPN
jgi:zinc protease